MNKTLHTEECCQTRNEPCGCPTLEDMWRKETPSCRTCGWCNAFYEIEDAIVKEGEYDGYEMYWAPCRSKDAEDTWEHKVYYLYVSKD